MNEVESLLIAAGFRHHFNGVTVGWFKRITIPVSYTHLDVYKRQEHETVLLGE